MEDHETCNNCRRDIPSQNYRMHSLHCARNIALCPQCDEPIPRGELEDHKSEEHGLKDCPGCSEKIEACKLEEHQASECQERTTLCKFCATHITVGSQLEHENYCGSRTEKCEECGEFIMLKNWELHIDSNHGFIKIKDEPGPKPSWEQKSSQKTSSTSSNSLSSTSYTPYSSTLAKQQAEEPPASTPAQRSNFSATELFNNQDLYSSRRYSSTTSSSVYRSASSSIVSSALGKSTSTSFASERKSSIVGSGLNKSTSSSQVTETERYSNGLSASKSFCTPKSSTALANAHVNSQVSKKTASPDAEVPGSVMLPCEFCEKMVPMQKLLSHQAECVNPSNVRAPLPRYSSSVTSALREASVSRSSSMNAGSGSSSMVSKYLRQSDTASPVESGTPNSTLSRYSSGPTNDSSDTPNRKISPKSGSIVNRYVSSPEPKASNGKNSFLPESPPSYEKEENNYAHYSGRSSYLREEAKKEQKAQTKPATKTRTKPQAPGMYENDDDREQLRQMLSSMRRDPMDVEEDPDNNDGSFFPCEFCGDPYPCEYLMRHQMSCDLNPQPVSSGSGFDYNSIKKSIGRNIGVSESSRTDRRSSVREVNDSDDRASDIKRETRRLSRSNSVIEKSSYSRSGGRASSVSRTSSFADRSYGTRSNIGHTSSFSMADYSSAVRRSSVFDGYAGYSIYSSISEGLDQITYGGRTSRRNSVTETNYSLSRRGSFSTRSDMPLPALMASLEASKTSNEETGGSREDRKTANGQGNSQTNSLLQNGHHSHLTNGYHRQNSQNDSPKAIDSPFGSTNGHISDLQRSDSKLVRRKSSLKHSQSGYKLERKVSFHSRDQIIADGEQLFDENGQPLPDKPKRKKERTEEEKQARRERKERKEAKRAARGMSKDRKCRSTDQSEASEPPPPPTKGVKSHPVGGDLFEQVSAKLQEVERKRSGGGEPSTFSSPQAVAPTLAPLPSTSLFPPSSSDSQNNPPANPNATSSGTNITATETVQHELPQTDNDNHTKTSNSDHSGPGRRVSVKGPAPQPPKEQFVNDLVTLDQEDKGDQASVTMRDHPSDHMDSKSCSKRNSLDNKSVQSLAKDLAAECAKAYELMESSLSKLTNDFSIGGPFGLTPKGKKKYRGPPAPTLKQ